MELLECQGCFQLEVSDVSKPCSLCGCAERAKPKKAWKHKYSKDLPIKVKK